MKISAVITTFNESQFLEAAINSVISQIYTPIEIIIVDDGSSCKTSQDIADKLMVTSSIPITYYYKDNGGPSSARNYGAVKAQGEYIAFLDVDDKWHEDHLSHKIDMLSKCRDFDKFFGVYGSFVFSDSMLTKNFRKIVASTADSSLIDNIGKLNGIPGMLPAFIINKSAYDAVGGFDETLTINEDFDLIIRFLINGFYVCGDSHPGFTRTMRDNSLTRNKNHLLTYNRLSTFLIKAEKMNYFTKTELKRRRYTAAFSTAKKILRVKFYDLSGVKLLMLGCLIVLGIK